jgi:phosphonate transport system substrate-binding protein
MDRRGFCTPLPVDLDRTSAATMPAGWSRSSRVAFTAVAPSGRSSWAAAAWPAPALAVFLPLTEALLGANVGGVSELGPPSSQRTPLRVGIVLAPTVTSVQGATAPTPVLEARLRAFALALGAATSMPTRPVGYDDYPALLDAMAHRELEIGWLPPVLAMRAAAAGRALPIAIPVRRGVASFHSALFAPVGSTILRPPDLVDARVAWVDRQSASGYLVIRAALRAQGVEFARAFSQELFFGSHQAVVRAVLDGKADVGATYLHHDSSGAGVWRAGWGDASVHVVARVGPIPSDVIAAGVHVPVAQIRAVQQALLTPTNLPLLDAARALLEADRFVIAESQHLRPLEELLDFLEDAARPWSSIVPPPDARLRDCGD